MDRKNSLSLSVLQSFCGNFLDTNPDALEAIWYAYWAEAYRGEKRFHPDRVFSSPQYPLTKYQLSSNGDIRDTKKVPDFLLLFVEGHRDSSRVSVAENQVTDYAKMIAYYMGNSVVDNHAVLAVCEIKSPPNVHHDDDAQSFQKAFNRKMKASQKAAISGAHQQLALYFSSMADEGKHVKGVAAIAAVGPFFAIANCEEDQIDALSNHTDSSFRSSDVSESSSESARRKQLNSLYGSRPLEPPEPNRPNLRPRDVLRQPTKYKDASGGAENSTALPSGSQNSMTAGQAMGSSAGHTSVANAGPSRGLSAAATVVRRQRSTRVAHSAPAPGADVRTRRALRAQGTAVKSGAVGRPGVALAGAHSRRAGDGAPQAAGQQTMARVTRNTTVAAASEPCAGPSNAGQGSEAAAEAPRAKKPSNTSERPSRIPRLSGGPSDLTRDVGTGVVAAQRDILARRMQNIRERLEPRRAPRERETRDLDWTPFVCWTDDSADAIKDELLRIIVENNPTLSVANPDGN